MLCSISEDNFFGSHDIYLDYDIFFVSKYNPKISSYSMQNFLDRIKMRHLVAACSGEMHLLVNRLIL